MRIAGINNSKNINSTKFGYNLPKASYGEYNLVSDLINNTANKLYTGNRKEYVRYIKALEDFRHKRFNATELANIYKPQIMQYDEEARSEWTNFISNLNPPIGTAIKDVSRTRTVKIKEKPIEHLINCIKGKKPQTRQVVETVQQPVKYYDISNIDVSVSGINSANPYTKCGFPYLQDNDTISIQAGNEDILLDDSEFKPEWPGAARYLKDMLSNADKVHDFMAIIDNKMEELFKINCNIILDSAKERAKISASEDCQKI